MVQTTLLILLARQSPHNLNERLAKIDEAVVKQFAVRWELLKANFSQVEALSRLTRLLEEELTEYSPENA